MKKLLCLLLTLVFVFSFFTAYASENTENKSLTELGITDETKELDKILTRAETAEILNRLFPHQNERVGTPITFSDIPDTHPSYEKIAYLHYMGIFLGDNEETFRPDDSITNIEFITTLVRLLGYESLASEEGGYPAGYLKVASKTGITKGLSLIQENFTSKADAIAMLYNFLDIPKRLASGYDAKTNKVTYVTDENNTYRNAFAEYDASLIEYSEINPHKTTN